MWGIVLGVVGVGLALYEIFTRPSAAELAAAAAAGGGVPTKPFNLGAPVRLNAQRAAACGLQPHDWNDAERWSSDRMGPTLPVLDRLKLIQSMVPPALWPASVRRVWCYLVAPLPATAGEGARPIQDVHWPGH